MNYILKQASLISKLLAITEEDEPYEKLIEMGNKIFLRISIDLKKSNRQDQIEIMEKLKKSCNRGFYSLWVMTNLKLAKLRCKTLESADTSN